MKQLVKGSAALTAVGLSELAMRFFRTKCIALILGASGIGLLAQLTNFFELIRAWGDLGSRRGVIKQIAEHQKIGFASEAYRRIVKTSFILALSASGLTSLIVAIYSHEISKHLFGSSEHYLYIISLAVLLPFSSISTVTGSILKGNLQSMAYAQYTLAAYLSVMLVTPGVIYLWHYWGAIAIQALFFIFPLAAYLIFNIKNQFLVLSGKASYSILKEQVSYGFLQVYQDTLGQVTRIIISTWIVKKLGLPMMGIYQVVVTFSMIFLSIPMHALFGYSLPLMAAAKTNDAVNKAINDSLRFVIFLMTPFVLLVMIWPEFFIYCFFSKEFFDARLPLEIQIAGAFFLILAFPFGVALQARGHLKALSIIATISPIVYWVSGLALFDKWELTGIAVAYGFMGLANLLLNYFIVRKNYQFLLDPKNIKLLVYTSIWIISGFLAGTESFSIFIRVLITAMIIPWFFLSSKPHEREYIINKSFQTFEKIKRFATQKNIF